MKRRAQKMNCPHCGHWDSLVDDTRGNPEYVWRVRECTQCGCRVGTEERITRILRPGTAQSLVKQNP